MPYVSARAIRIAQEMSYQLSACRSSLELEHAATAFLLDTIGADYCAINELRPGPEPLRVVMSPPGEFARLVRRSLLDQMADPRGTDYPSMRHYFSRDVPITPIRLADLISDRDLRRTRVFHEMLRAVGAGHQLALPVRRNDPRDSAGYSLTRTGPPFTDDDLDLATVVQPALCALHRVLSAPPVPHRAELPLTSAEAEVLALLATGMTAVAIGHARRVSTRTVRKQLEHIYGKLGLHDRLQAVTYARDAGLIQPGAGSRVRA